MRPTNNFLPLTKAIFLGLAISLIASSPVHGDTVPLCQGSGNSSSTAQVVLGGRVITPSTLLRTASGQPCGVNETGLNIVSTTRTVVVSPNGTPTQNGTALLAAMNTISNANPSATNPWLLKLEPGMYDLGIGSLTLKPYVDLEGSGEGTTTISSTVTSPNFPASSATLVMASNTAVRFITLINSGSGNFSTALLVGSGASSVSASHIAISVYGGSNSFGLSNIGGKLNLSDSTISSSGSATGYGLVNHTATAALRLTTTTVSGNGGSGYGLVNNGGTLSMLDSTLNSNSSGNNQGYGLYNNGGTSSVHSSSLNAVADSALAYGLYNTGGTTRVQATNLTSYSNDTGYGIYNQLNSTIIVQTSVVTSTSSAPGYGLYNNGGTSTVQHSTLSSSAGNNTGYGLYNNGGISTVQHSTLKGVSKGNAYGLFTDANGVVTVQGSALSGSGPSTGYGFSSTNSTSTIQFSTLNGFGTSSGVSLYIVSGNTTVENGVMTSSGNASYAIYKEGGSVVVKNSTLTATGNNSGYGLFNDGGTGTLHNSLVTGSGNNSYGIFNNNTASPIRVGASQLSGGFSTVGGVGSVICVGSYNTNFIMLSPSCV